MNPAIVESADFLARLVQNRQDWLGPDEFPIARSKGKAHVDSYIRVRAAQSQHAKGNHVGK